MKKWFAILLVISIVMLGSGIGVIAEARESVTPYKPLDSQEEKTWFQTVTGRDLSEPATKPIYLKDSLVVSMPVDWSPVSVEDAQYAYAGTDNFGNQVVVRIGVLEGENITTEELENEFRTAKYLCKIQREGITFYCAFEDGKLYSAWLAGNGDAYALLATWETLEVMRSEKLTADLHQILCELRPVHDGELEMLAEQEALKSADLSGEEPVHFRDAEFEGMLRQAMGRKDDEAIYPSELAAIRNLTLRTGLISFTENILDYQTGYRQSAVLDLADLPLFPKLRRLSITDMKCASYENLAALPELAELTLIRTGVTDCSVFRDLELNSLSLAGNKLSDFSRLSGMTGLKSLNLYSTGLDSLSVVRGMVDLEQLVVGDNPITDLDPLSDMTQLTTLYIQGTKVQSLEPLRALKALERLNISNLEGEISLEPLHEHPNIQEINVGGTQISQADREIFKDLLSEFEF